MLATNEKKPHFSCLVGPYIITVHKRPAHNFSSKFSNLAEPGIVFPSLRKTVQFKPIELDIFQQKCMVSLEKFKRKVGFTDEKNSDWL